jgi:hypothetical protein
MPSIDIYGASVGFFDPADGQIAIPSSEVGAKTLVEVDDAASQPRKHSGQDAAST